jgi:hypothetical protein
MNRYLSICGFVSLVFSLALSGCKTNDVQGQCNQDGDCDSVYFYCAENQCLCKSDLACLEGEEFCNALGHCQKYTGCRVDTDCGDTEKFRCQIGDAHNGVCLCKKDTACQSGEFCNTSGVCQKKEGCLADADCGTPATSFRCYVNPETSIGECLCRDEQACKQGEFCNSKGYCQPSTTCQNNEDCPAGRKCKTETGECLCDHDANTGCKSKEVCNVSGYCQPRPGCYDNRDCADTANYYCDTETKTCIPVGTCGADRQCPAGQICASRQCTDGCRSSDDCPLDAYCNTSYKCVTGCRDNKSCEYIDSVATPACQDTNSCGLLDNCTNGQCKPAGGLFCNKCSSGTQTYCDNGNTAVCLIYPYDSDGFNSDGYCSPICDAEHPNCPNGMDCGPVITILNTANLQDPFCGGTHGNCPNGVPCVIDPEQPDKGYCPCHDALNPCSCVTVLFSKVCINNPSQTCVTDADCGITCQFKDEDGFGGCLFAYTCGLEQGFHCPPGHP